MIRLAALKVLLARNGNDDVFFHGCIRFGSHAIASLSIRRDVNELRVHACRFSQEHLCVLIEAVNIV